MDVWNDFRIKMYEKWLQFIGYHQIVSRRCFGLPIIQKGWICHFRTKFARILRNFGVLQAEKYFYLSFQALCQLSLVLRIRWYPTFASQCILGLLIVKKEGGHFRTKFAVTSGQNSDHKIGISPCLLTLYSIFEYADMLNQIWRIHFWYFFHYLKVFLGSNSGIIWFLPEHAFLV